MRWFVVMITLNGSEYLWYSLKYVYDFIKDNGCMIIIVKGSTKYSKIASEDGNSKDKSRDIIGGFIKDSEKDFIIHRKIGKVENKQELRNTYFEIIRGLSKEDQPDWILMLDDDELYKKEDLQKLDKFLIKNPKIEYIFNHQRWFWGDFKHVGITNETACMEQIKAGKRKDKIFYDAVGNRLRQGQYHERIFKWNPSIKYVSHSVITDEEGRDVYIDPYYENKRIVFSGCPRYHYGYLTSFKKMYERYRYYEERDQNKISNAEADVWKELIKARSQETELLSELWRFWEKKLECETKKS